MSFINNTKGIDTKGIDTKGIDTKDTEAEGTAEAEGIAYIDAAGNTPYIGKKEIEVLECSSDIEESHYLDDNYNDNDKENKMITLKTSKLKNILYAPIFLETKMPIDGWIQGCIGCNANTSNTIFYKDEKYNNIGYMVYCCRTCVHTKERNIEMRIEYNDTILDYIDTYKEIIYAKVRGHPVNPDNELTPDNNVTPDNKIIENKTQHPYPVDPNPPLPLAVFPNSSSLFTKIT
jgi:hypothetical protein